MQRQRCSWVNLNNPLYIAYHDTEWGVPVHDDQKLFEFLVLESAQAGLSWETILNRREGYRKAFKNFDYTKIAKFTSKDIERCMHDGPIIRNRLKIELTISNAHAFLKIRSEFGSFVNYFWNWKKAKAKDNTYADLSVLISKDLKKRGFKFVGPTIMYAYMQAVGMVNDHDTTCFRHNMGTTHVANIVN